jgi:hypothetical protein
VNDKFLSRSDIKILTERSFRKDQIAWLKSHGYKFDIGGKGGIVILWAHVNHKLAYGKAPVPEPDFGMYA